MRKLPNFIILTSKSILDIPYENDSQHEHDVLLLVDEQYNILKSNGIGFSKCYKLHFFDTPYTSDHTTVMEIDEAIQCLAIKDGYDVAEFKNGNIGFVAYYSGVENGFEILGEAEEE